MDYRSAWGEDRVYFYNKEERLSKLPAAWTDVAPTDPFVAVAAERSPFRCQDLLRLAELIERFEDGVEPDDCKANNAAIVKTKTPNMQGDGGARVSNISNKYRYNKTNHIKKT